MTMMMILIMIIRMIAILLLVLLLVLAFLVPVPLVLALWFQALWSRPFGPGHFVQALCSKLNRPETGPVFPEGAPRYNSPRSS